MKPHQPEKTVSAVWRKGMNYVKVNAIWHITYDSVTDHTNGSKMKAKTFCGHILSFDAIARGEEEKSDYVCAECEMLFRAGDELLRSLKK